MKYIYLSIYPPKHSWLSALGTMKKEQTRQLPFQISAQNPLVKSPVSISALEQQENGDPAGTVCQLTVQLQVGGGATWH